MNHREDNPLRTPLDNQYILGPSQENLQESSQWTNLTREDAMACVLTIERDLDDLEGQRDERSRQYTPESMAEAKREVRDVRTQLNDLSGQAPDAWGEMQDAVGAALRKLEDSFQRVVGTR